jgi:hypothetical protein
MVTTNKAKILVSKYTKEELANMLVEADYKIERAKLDALEEFKKEIDDALRAHIITDKKIAKQLRLVVDSHIDSKRLRV